MSLYLEVSARQSGKTQRLLDTAKNSISVYPYTPCVIFTTNLDNKKYLQKRLLGMGMDWQQVENALKLQIMTINMPMIDSITNEIRNFSNYKLFFDEFDFYQNLEFWNILQGTNFNINNCYFVTTPKYRRKLKDLIDIKTSDQFAKLLQYNKFDYVTYPPLLLKSDKSEKFSMLPNETYLTEIEGLFIK